MTATKLVARPYVPDPPERPVRSFMSLAQAILEQKPPDWPEIRSGDRGLDISRCRFVGLRDLTTSDASAGYLAKSSQPVDFIDVTVAESMVGPAGAQYLRPDGDWSGIPRASSAGEGVWINRDGGAPMEENTMAFSLVSRSPHLVTFSCDVSRVLRVVSGGLADKVINRTATKVLGAALGKAGLSGSGVDDQPRGVLNSPILTMSGAAYSWASVTEHRRLIEVANFSPTAWFCSPAVAKLLRGRERVTDSGIYIIDDNGRIGGLPVFVTGNMPDDQLLLGDWSKLIICAESIQVVLDPFSQANSGVVSLRFFLFADALVADPAAFVAATSVS